MCWVNVGSGFTKLRWQAYHLRLPNSTPSNLRVVLQKGLTVHRSLCRPIACLLVEYVESRLVACQLPYLLQKLLKLGSTRNANGL
jgi:hypothetical protein